MKRRSRPRITVIAVLLAGLWGASLAWSHWRGGIGLLDRIEAPLTDLRFLLQGPRPAPDSIAIIAIDDETVQTAGSYPLSRIKVARLIDAVGRMGAKMVALDLLFLDPGQAKADQALATAVSKIPSVLAAAATFDGSAQTLLGSSGSELDRVPSARSILLPIKSLREAAAIGAVNLSTDPSGVPRHVPLLIRSGDRLVPSFPLRAAAIVARHDPIIGRSQIDVGPQTISADLGYSLPLRFYGPRGSIRTFSASEIIKGRLNATAIRNKVVVIGATVTGGGDFFPTPFDSVLPGVEVMATAIAHLIEGDELIRDWRVRLVDGGVAVALPVLLVLLLSWHRSIWGFVAITGAALLWVGLTAVTFAYGIWLSAALPLAAATPPVILFGGTRLWLDRKRAEELAEESSTLRNFQSPSLVEKLRRDPTFLAQPVRQGAALIFIDLSGFTGLSEIIGPDQTREIIRGFHTLVGDEAAQRHGVVGNFMGDGAMVIFGIPEPSSDDACHAIVTCVGLSSRTQTWLSSLPAPIRSRLGFKIGAHYGTIIASRLGTDHHQHITAIGDTVNVASRLMEVAATHRAEVALSEDLLRAARAGCSALESGLLSGKFEASIRGRSGTIAVRLWRSRTGDQANTT
ncbi:adenylate/guanylate cyclase domain-containing protein (plasmid) [Microvirga terrae]|uniref:Adenylate/guanylate cyclase domain-containing protein n=1 Tax=Microvirga terrae TaxID=2740529 RepID=A0ABY5RZ29_9HYPH|nr:adenylate/guanylate cyclase domain-containing protein [Microvirga terrae]UVF22214.1 adenylate/guanylate cyclase domain-containing protein [Microvirga terrae]